MHTYHQAKDKCKDLLVKAQQLYTEACRNIINKELNDYLSHEKKLKKVSENRFLLEDSIEVYSGDGLLTIDDRRYTPFRWLFELEFFNILWLSDNIFVGDKYINSVEYMTVHEFEDYKEIVESIIQKLEKSIEVLSSGIVETWSHKYNCDEPHAEGNSIEAVFEIVTKNIWKF